MKTLLLAASIATITLTGCSNANMGAVSAWGQDHIVKQYCGDKQIGEWETTGKVENEAQSDGYYFTDKATGKLVAISPCIQITVK